MIFRKFSQRQRLAMTWWNRPSLQHYDGIFCDGAVRSGKTMAMTVGFFLWSMASFDGGVFALCGKTVGAVRRNILIHLQDWLGGSFQIREHRSENRLTVQMGNRRNTYYLFGGQDAQSADLIQGMTLWGILLDEAVLMPRSFVEQAVARCSVPGSKWWFSCNPAGPEHWLKKEWLDKCGEKNLLRLHFTMADNPGLDPAVRQRYEKLYQGVFYRRFVLGQWCGAEGLVYDFREENLCKTPPGAGRYYISVDYGTRNPFSAGLWCVHGGKAYRIREIYWDGRERGMRTDEEYYAFLQRLAGSLPVEQVIVDPSAASFIAVIRRHGQFRVRKANNAVLPGIRLVAELLKNGRLQICEGCKAAVREFGLYRWEDGRDVPVKENDHAMDEIRYFCMAVMRRIEN